MFHETTVAFHHLKDRSWQRVVHLGVAHIHRLPSNAFSTTIRVPRLVLDPFLGSSGSSLISLIN